MEDQRKREVKAGGSTNALLEFLDRIAPLIQKAPQALKSSLYLGFFVLTSGTFILWIATWIFPNKKEEIFGMFFILFWLAVAFTLIYAAIINAIVFYIEGKNKN